MGGTTDSRHALPVAANLLDRNFAPARLGKVWVSEVTYLPSNQGWLYLTTVMDLADRQILGWNLSQTMNASQTSVAAFIQAVAKRTPTASLLFHSDRGIQYACTEFTSLLAARKITQSMSRKGNCWDNAPAESFFKTLKAELQMDRPFSSYGEARTTIFTFIDLWYNRKRLHSALNYQTPIQAARQLTHNKAA
ncbi:IS3 family transposase [Aliifodinibius salipaludis]|uniref:IS3 family transposase n=1 Tax=Fodinibius salipaludis TaxID=2032627 RepID=UPI0033137CAC